MEDRETDSSQDFQVLQEIIETINSSLELHTVLDRIVALVSDVTAADACLLYLLDRSMDVLVLRASKPPHPEAVGDVALRVGEGVTGTVAKARQSIVIERQAVRDPRFKPFQQLPEDHYEAFLSAPIITRDRLIGVINVQHREPHAYAPETVTLVETIGRLVGGAVVNAQVYDIERRRSQELETLSQVTEAVVSSRYLDEILQLIVTVTAELMGSKICSLMLLDETKQALVIKATQALSAAYRNKPPIQVGESISGLVVRERRPITVRDVTRDERYRYPEIAKREGLKSLLSVPMTARNRIVGVINCYTAKERRFSRDDIQVLSTIANQAAAAIERTHLIEEAMSAREALETRKVVEQAKGLLMAEAGLTEEQAFRLLQKQSMEKRKSMREIAEAILMVRELKQRP